MISACNNAITNSTDTKKANQIAAHQPPVTSSAGLASAEVDICLHTSHSARRYWRLMNDRSQQTTTPVTHLVATRLLRWRVDLHSFVPDAARGGRRQQQLHPRVEFFLLPMHDEVQAGLDNYQGSALEQCLHNHHKGKPNQQSSPGLLRLSCASEPHRRWGFVELAHAIHHRAFLAGGDCV